MKNDIAQHMLVLAKSLYEGGTLTAMKIRELVPVSKATAHRYMVRLEVGLPVFVVDEQLQDRGACTTRRHLRLMKPPSAK